ncbi:EamA family transporter [Lactococcus taiwanensis]|uniref:EamA family transporter n=1 Tax=Lactococcus taiwanensis TaxID=1151742 RepID=A0AA45KF16_9LACT|nr:EamA family transporter [Lactococcus taiwanensis]QSE76148.1 EamA family transporter [Lactococcus taiwanensis]
MYKFKGVAYASLGAAFFGISSILAGILFKRCAIQPGWLVTIRMLFSGLILLCGLGVTKNNIFSVWYSFKSSLRIIAFGILGVLFAQTSFLLSVFYGNAAIATILQSLGPSIIIVILAIKSKTLPRRLDIIAIFLSLIGVFLLVTNGNLGKLSFSASALIWGLLSALGVCAYTLIPCPLLRDHSALNVVAWALLIGGIISNFFHPLTVMPTNIDQIDLLLILLIVIIGTLLAYSLYINSLKYTEPHVVGMLGMLEPVTAILISTLLLNVSFLGLQRLGILIVFLALFLINLPTNHK